MDKHTPGPWLIEDHGGNHAYLSGRNWIGFVEVVVRMGTAQTVSPEGMANARLIAAAPELLEALRKTKTCQLSTEVRDVVNAAIAKATTSTERSGS